MFIWFQSGILTNWSWAKAKEGRRGKAGWGTKKCCKEAADTAWRNTTATTSRGQEENGIQECNSRPEVRIMTDDFFQWRLLWLCYRTFVLFWWLQAGVENSFDSVDTEFWDYFGKQLQ